MKHAFLIVTLGGLLIVMSYSFIQMPAIGSEEHPAFNEVSQYYLQRTVQDTNALNVVAVIITDYRALDTLGEATVLFTSVAAVLSVLVVAHPKPKKKMDEENHG
jgi:multisubunit Na+/H+ antiporter MnhB subunit